MNLRMIASLLGGLANGRQNKKLFWASLLGLGVSATAMGLRKTRYRNFLPKVQHAAERFLPGSMMGNTAMAEFSSELLPNKAGGAQKNRSNQLPKL